jgi:hypothetical protein
MNGEKRTSIKELPVETMGQKKEVNQGILEEIIKSIQQINYGEVVLTIHNSKIVQIEKKEKKRF